MRQYVDRIIRSISLRFARKANYKFILKDWIRLFDLELCSQVLETKRFYQNLQPVEIDAPRAKRIVVVAPHPDDDIFGAGGTLIKAISNGAQVDVIYVASITGNPSKNKLVRAEATEVCNSLGARPHFMDCDSKNIPLNDSRLNDDLRSLIGGLKPEALFTTFLLDDHDDHRRINQLLLNIFDNSSFNPEIWAYQIYSTVITNVVVDISGHIDNKKRLIKMYKSVSGNRDWAHYILGLNAFNSRYIPGKKEIYAEVFFVVPFNEYMSLCKKYFSNPPEKVYYSENYRHSPGAPLPQNA